MEAALQLGHDRPPPWNADDLDRLCELMALGKTVPEAAKILGRSYGSVKTKARKLGRM